MTLYCLGKFQETCHIVKHKERKRCKVAEDRSFVLWTRQLVNGNRAARTTEKHGNSETHTYLDKAESQGQNVEESLAWAKPKLNPFI